VTPVADGNPERQAAFEARKAGLIEKAMELAEMEEAAVAAICTGIDGQGATDYWPSLEAVKALAEKFHQLPQEIRSTVEHASYVEGLRDAKVWEDSIAAELDGLSEEALREMLASIEASQEATRSRILDLQPQPDESVAENSVAGEEAASPASGEVQGKLKQLPEDLTEKPEPASGNAAPWRARKPRVSRAASVQVRGRQKHSSHSTPTRCRERRSNHRARATTTTTLRG
jgi:hypothetical protein